MTMRAKHEYLREKSRAMLDSLEKRSAQENDFDQDLKEFLGEFLSFDCGQDLCDEEHLLRLSAAFEQSANAIFLTDVNGNIEYANPRFYQVSEYKPGEILGQNPRILKYKGSKINYKELWETISRGKTLRGCRSC